MTYTEEQISKALDDIRAKREQLERYNNALLQAQRELEEEKDRKSEHPRKVKELNQNIEANKDKLISLEDLQQAHHDHLAELNEIQKRKGLVNGVLHPKVRKADNDYLKDYNVKRDLLAKTIPAVQERIKRTDDDISNAKASIVQTQVELNDLDDTATIQQKINDKKDLISDIKSRISNDIPELETSERAFESMRDLASIEEENEANITKRQKTLKLASNIAIGVGTALLVSTALSPIGLGTVAVAGISGASVGVVRNIIEAHGHHDSLSGFASEAFSIKSNVRAAIAGVASAATFGAIDGLGGIDNIIDSGSEMLENANIGGRASQAWSDVSTTFSERVLPTLSDSADALKSAFEANTAGTLENLSSMTDSVKDFGGKVLEEGKEIWSGYPEGALPDATSNTATETPPVWRDPEITPDLKAIFAADAANGHSLSSVAQEVKEIVFGIDQPTPTVTEAVTAVAASDPTNITSANLIDLKPLLDNLGGTDTQVLENIIEHATEYGANPSLINAMQAKLDAGFNFIDSASSAEVVRERNAFIASALKDGGVVTPEEYKGALEVTMGKLSEANFVSDDQHDSYLPKGTREGLTNASNTLRAQMG